MSGVNGFRALGFRVDGFRGLGDKGLGAFCAFIETSFGRGMAGP